MSDYKEYTIESSRDREFWNLIEDITARKKEDGVIVDFIRLNDKYKSEKYLDDLLSEIKDLINKRTIDDEIRYIINDLSKLKQKTPTSTK